VGAQSTNAGNLLLTVPLSATAAECRGGGGLHDVDLWFLAAP